MIQKHHKILALLFAGVVGVTVQAQAATDFVPEPIGNVAKLAEQYPDNWLLVQDFSFFHMLEGKVLVVDPLAESLGDQYKGMMTASFIAAFQRSKVRNEHYVVETFYSRGGRGGERTDVVAVYDPATLKVIDEIEIAPKRITGMPKNMMTGFIDNERFLGVYNFTPGQSVSIVDLESRTFVGEVSTAGCGFVIPNGTRSFSSICSNGSLLTSHLNEDGTLADTTKSKVLFDPEGDPIFETMGVVDGIAYFPTFSGQILPIDVSKKVPRAKALWWLTSAEERNWRPGGMFPLAVDASGLGYVLMNPEGAEGTHKDGGSEVWVYDLAKQKRLQRFALNTWGLSLGTTGIGDNRLLAVTNAEMAVDVYRIDGEFVKTLNVGAATPFMVHGTH